MLSRRYRLPVLASSLSATTVARLPYRVSRLPLYCFTEMGSFVKLVGRHHDLPIPWTTVMGHFGQQAMHAPPAAARCLHLRSPRHRFWFLIAKESLSLLIHGCCVEKHDVSRGVKPFPPEACRMCRRARRLPLSSSNVCTAYKRVLLCSVWLKQHQITAI